VRSEQSFGADAPEGAGGGTAPPPARRRLVARAAAALVVLVALYAGRELWLPVARGARALLPRPVRYFSHEAARRPFGPGGAPWQIPGVVEAEGYDLGTTDDPAYGDTTPGSQAPADQRYRDDDVDVGVDRVLGLADVAWVEAGEWLEYTIAAAAPGRFSVTVRLATPRTGRRFRLELDGIDATGDVDAPDTGCWGSDLRGHECFGEVTTRSFIVDAGVHRMRFVAVTGGYTVDRFAISREH
jgi:hypothetical protein